MLMQDFTAQTQQATQDRDEKAESNAKKRQAKADDDADANYWADLTATCEQKASNFGGKHLPGSCRHLQLHSSALALTVAIDKLQSETAEMQVQMKFAGEFHEKLTMI